MTLEQLRVFVTVAELEHVTRASYALDMMQSAVSKSVAALEGETGLRLFDRVGRNIRLTVVGAAYRDHARELLDHARRLESWAEASRPRYPKVQPVQWSVDPETRETNLLKSRIVLGTG